MVVMRDHPVAAANELQDDGFIAARRAAALVTALEQALSAAQCLLAAIEAIPGTCGNVPLCPQRAATSRHGERGQPCDAQIAAADSCFAATTPTTDVGRDALVRLSRREAQIVGLLAAGRSNREIAAALCLSPRTVQRHVANAYAKIGAHNKAEATAYALRYHLL
jgi:DNA-binding NarL/FixJ family response regulator